MNKVKDVNPCINIKVNELRCLLLTCAQVDVRYYLEGICFDVADGVLTMVTTNGHTLSCCPNKDTQNMEGLNFRDVIHRSVFESLLSNKTYLRTLAPTNMVMTMHKSGGMWRIETEHVNFMVKPIDCKYPEWRKVVPKEHMKSDPASFQLDYLVMLQKISKLLGNKMQPMNFDGNNSASIKFSGSDYQCVVMPLRV